MSVEQVPLVLLPRFTTLVGGGAFSTTGIDATLFSTAHVHVYRGPLLGAGAFEIHFEESMDRARWAPCQGDLGGDPGPELEASYSVSLQKKWFRTFVVLSGGPVGVTCYAVGSLELRGG